ncbi:hypothetical protein Mal15_32030 [Stieleria maiorica]|uniref:TRASH domain-containing protein n=1 Tax=Stieleria maiorica TaxID=2795974 RepID=A0A5B9MEA5_9BACT|nr:hypothetical protein [Stieleria maiorica]QEF99143.1 hypothetical protein Mal15_32030 [Stieleria maiorica]
MKSFSILTLALLLLGLPGCAGDTETTATPAPTATPPSEATLTALKKADLLDGSEDHVIKKCYVCSLAMDGDEKYSAELHGYKAHLCSDHCREKFEASPETVIAGVEIPD